jgi:two-component system, LuxR family, response regulator FixJ
LIQISAQDPDSGSDWGSDEEVSMPVPLATHRPPVATDKRICIVDDDEWVAESLKLLLETFGFEVWSYGSGADFLADCRHRSTACLIIDQHMPGMSGLDVVAHLQWEGIRRPTILISGRLDTNTTERAAGLGVTRVVEKPFEADRLVDFIRTALLERN